MQVNPTLGEPDVWVINTWAVREIIVSDRLRLATVILALIAVAACSEDGTSTVGQQEVDLLAGSWQVISYTDGDNTVPWPEGINYWHFKNDGQCCTEDKNGYGYYVFSCGQVSRSLLLTEVYHSGFVRESQLVLSQDGDSLSSQRIEATGPGSDRIDLVRSADRDTTDCECD
jgi:hypothetical protein